MNANKILRAQGQEDELSVHNQEDQMEDIRRENGTIDGQKLVDELFGSAQVRTKQEEDQELMKEIFGDVISTYTRRQAIEDGVLVDLDQDTMGEVCRSHYKYPIAATIEVFEIMNKAVQNKKHLNDFAGVLHDMLWMSKVYKRQISETTVIFRVKIKGAGRRSVYDFKLVVGPGDDGEPVITIMNPEQD
jgi:hypothetical protein